MDKKTREVILRTVKEHSDATITVVMKTCYLIDLVARQRLGKQITSFKYIRYNYGPFDPSIYSCLNTLIGNDTIVGQASYFGVGNEVITYKLSDSNLFIESTLKKDEKAILDEVLSSIRGLGAKILTEIAYNTAPMKKLGATLGGKEALGASLDLNAR